MTTVLIGDGPSWAVKVSSDWHAANYAASLNDNRAITFWDICYSAQGSGNETAVKEAAGGRWRIGYWEPTNQSECSDTNRLFLRRMNGTLGGGLSRTAGKAWNGGTGYSTNTRMKGNDWTTLCPAPMANNPVFPASDPGRTYGWGCVVFDTYMHTAVAAAQALLRASGAPTYDHRWCTSAHGGFILGFDYDKTDGTATTMRAVGQHCVSQDGRRLDGDRVAPNDQDATPDNREWTF